MAQICHVAERPVDLEHLGRYTGGNRALDAEILELFATQCAELLIKLEALAASSDAKNWHDVTHSLKGAARGIGAFALADAAATAENAEPGAPAAADALRQIKTKADAVNAFVADFLKG